MFPKHDLAVPLLGALCVAEGLLSQAQLEACLQLQTSRPATPIGQIFCQQGFLCEDDLVRMLALQRTFRRTLVERIERQMPTHESATAREQYTSMLPWEAVTDDYRTCVQTLFAQLHVCVDPWHTSLAGDVRFRARVETIKGSELASIDNFISLSAARVWCEAQYAELLRAELSRVEAQAAALSHLVD